MATACARELGRLEFRGTLPAKRWTTLPVKARRSTTGLSLTASQSGVRVDKFIKHIQSLIFSKPVHFWVIGAL